MPATAVGSANGRSTNESRMRFPGKLVAHQAPTRRAFRERSSASAAKKRGAEAQARTMPWRAALSRRARTACQSDLRRFHERGRERDQHDERKVENREAERQTESGDDARTTSIGLAQRAWLLIRLVDLIEDPAVGEVRRLRFRPTAETVDVTSFIAGNCEAYRFATDASRGRK